MSKVTLTDENKIFPSCQSQKTLHSFKCAKRESNVATIQNYMDSFVNPSRDVAKAKHPPTFRQWYYSLHYFLHFRKEIASRNKKNSVKPMPLGAGINDERVHNMSSTYGAILPIISSLLSYYWKKFYSNMYLGICFVGPTASNFILWIFFGCSIMDLQFFNRQLQGKETLLQKQDFTPIQESKEMKPGVDNSTYLTTKLMTRKSDNIIKFIDTDGKSIESILQSEMSQPSPWRHIPYLFTSTVLKIIEDMSFNMNNINDRIVFYLYQELEPILIIILEETIQRRIYTRIHSNINDVFSQITNVVVHSNRRKLIKDFTIRFQNCMQTPSSFSTILLPHLQRNGSQCEIQENIGYGNNVEHLSNNTNHPSDQKCTLTLRTQEKSCKKTTSASFSAHLNSHHLEQGCTTLPILRQTKSCVQIICRENTTPLSKKKLSEVKSCIFKKINTAATTLVEGKRSKPTNPSKVPFFCNFLNETGCESTKRAE